MALNLLPVSAFANTGVAGVVNVYTPEEIKRRLRHWNFTAAIPCWAARNTDGHIWTSKRVPCIERRNFTNVSDF